jgi:hypothetical protein
LYLKGLCVGIYDQAGEPVSCAARYPSIVPQLTPLRRGVLLFPIILSLKKRRDFLIHARNVNGECQYDNSLAIMSHNAG